LPEKREMARGSHGQRAQMLSVEWMKSISTEGSICKLIDGGVLPDATIGGMMPSIGESYPEPCPGELVIFEDFY
jgi:hypothetical protein